MHPEAFQIKSRVCVSDFNLLALQTQLLSKITVQKPYILFQLAFKKKKSLDESCRYPETSATDATSIQIST